jgi:hypothetical protein
LADSVQRSNRVFWKLDLFPFSDEVWEISNLLGPLERANPNSWILMTYIDAVSEKPCSVLQNTGEWYTNIQKQTPWPQSASELYRPSDRRLSMKLVPTFADRGCRVISATDPYGRILDFLDRSRNCSFQVAPQLYLLS